MTTEFGVGDSEYAFKRVPPGQAAIEDLLLLYGAAFAEPPWSVQAEEPSHPADS